MSPSDAGADPLQVVLVTYSPGESLAACLDSLAGASAAALDVTLADNGSGLGEPGLEDPALARAVTRPGVRLLELAGNVGYGRAANAGAATGRGDWLLVANPDVVFDEGSLDVLLAAAARHPRAGALGPAIRTVGGELYPSARAFPNLTLGIGHAVFGWWWPANPWTRAYRNEQGAPSEGPTGWLSGSCLLLRRTAFEAVGGFDPSYFMYFEDLDLCRRLAAAGWENVHVPAAQVLHTGGHATQRDPATAAAMLRAHHRSAYLYLSRQYSGPRNVPIRLVLRLALSVRALLGRLVPALGAGARPTRSADVL